MQELRNTVEIKSGRTNPPIIESFRLEILNFFILKEAVIVYDFLILIGKARDGVKVKINHFRKLRLLYHLLTAKGKHAFRVTSDLAQYQGFSISKGHFRVSLNFIQVGLVLTCNCTIRKQTHRRQVISWI